ELSDGRGIDALINVAGGARGAESVEHGSIDDWRWMFEANVLATKRLTTAVLPLLRRAATDRGVGSIVTVTSTAAFTAYQGGGGYNAAKFAEHAMFAAMRLELAGEPIRVIEVAPGMVKTEEFALNRLGGNADAAAAVYQGVDEPLTGADIADVIVHALSAPKHVNLDLIVVRPVAQAAQHMLVREPLRVRDGD
ncbi:MAG: SDR family NAD(P)-dependent oxidoreductase, partial [Agromyces sp.]